MNTLEALKFEAREKILGVAVNRQSSLYDIEVLAGELATRIYTAALQGALGKVFEVDAAFKDQMKIVRAIRSLLPKNEV